LSGVAYGTRSVISPS